MKILEKIFGKKKADASSILVEEKPNVKDSSSNLKAVSKFVDIDMDSRIEFKKISKQPAVQIAIPGKAMAAPLKNPADNAYYPFIKIRMNPYEPIDTTMLPSHPRLRFIGTSRIDGCPIYQYMGTNIREISDVYDFEEIISLNDRIK